MLHHALYLPVQGKGWERSETGNPLGLIREQSVNPVGVACNGHSTNHRSSHLTWWPRRSRVVLGIDLDITVSAITQATFMPPGHSRQHVHPGKCFLCCFLNLHGTHRGLSLKHKRWMKLNFWLVSPVKHLMLVLSLMFSWLEGRETIPFSSATYEFFTGAFWVMWNNTSGQHTALFNTVQDTLKQPCICTIHSYPKIFFRQWYWDWEVWIWLNPLEAHHYLGWRCSCRERRKHAQKCLLLLLNVKLHFSPFPPLPWR